MLTKKTKAGLCLLLSMCLIATACGRSNDSSFDSSSESIESLTSSESSMEDSSLEDSSSEEDSSEDTPVIDESGQIVEMGYHSNVSNAETLGFRMQNASGTFDFGYVADDWYRVEGDYAFLEQVYIKGVQASTIDGVFLVYMCQTDSLYIGIDTAGGLNMQVGDSIVFPYGLVYENSNGVAFKTLYTFQYVWNGEGYTVGKLNADSPDVPGYVILEDYKTVNKNRMFGIAEPLLEKQEHSDKFQVVGFNADVTLEYLQMLNVKSFRLMLPVTVFSRYMMFGPGDFEIELNEEIVAYFKGIIRDLRNCGVENIILQTNIYPKPAGFGGGYQSLTVPSRTDAVYGDWCLLLEEQWRVLAQTFYEVNYFEVGNETNQHAYLYKADGSKFTEEEVCAINTDLMYYANRGLERGNPYAYCVTPGFSSLGTLNASADSMDTGASIRETLDAIYKNIKSGNFPYGDTKSTDVEDYFKVIGLHTYEYNDWNNFQSNMMGVINLINGYDNGRKIFITEMGWPDFGNEQNLAGYPEKVTRLYKILNALPQVETACYFRLYNCDYALTWGGNGEESFGLFTEPSSSAGFVAKPLAKTLQTLFGGSGDLDKYADLAVLESKLGYTLF